MGSQQLLSKLAGLRFREKALALAWGLGRTVAIVLGVVLIACLFDWAVDDASTVNVMGGNEELPNTRVLLYWLLGGLGAIALTAGLVWVLVPVAMGSAPMVWSGLIRLAIVLGSAVAIAGMLTWILWDAESAMKLTQDGTPAWVSRMLLCLTVLSGVVVGWFWAGWPYQSGDLPSELALRRMFVVLACTVFFAFLIIWPMGEGVLRAVNRGGQGTPHWLNRILLGVTLVTLALAAYYWVVLPLLHRLSDDTLALWVEQHHPELGHRLISTVQLDREGAYRQGMSPELIELTGAQANAQCGPMSFAGVADHSRLGWAAAIGIPAIFFAIVPFLIHLDLAKALFARHLLGDAEIPRHISIQNEKDQLVRPVNEPFALDYWIASRDGQFPPGEGRVIVRLANRYSDIYSLKPVIDERGQTREDEKGRRLYRASIKPTSQNLIHIAQLGDGRSKAGNVQIVPRPTIARLNAWSVLPVEYVGLSPLGLPYMKLQSQGDIVGILRSKGHVEAEVENEIVKARLDLLVPTRAKKDEEDVVPEVVKRSLDMSILKREKDGRTIYVARSIFELRPEESSYRITVTDRHNLENVPPLTRRLFVKEEEAPEVFLRKDYWTDRAGKDDPISNFEKEGVPVPVGEAVRVPYVAYGPYGIGKAQFLFRIAKKTESAAEAAPDTPWIRLDLKPHATDPAVDGAFDDRRGVFENTKNSQSIEFYPVPPVNDDPTEVPYTTAGGRFHFQTKFLRGPDAQLLKKGDTIEYCIEVWPRHVDPEVSIASRPVGKSKTGVVTLGSHEDFDRWLKETQDEFRRLKELEKKQGKVFGNP